MDFVGGPDIQARRVSSPNRRFYLIYPPRLRINILVFDMKTMFRLYFMTIIANCKYSARIKTSIKTIVNTSRAARLYTNEIS
jgi:hypothetical protein